MVAPLTWFALFILFDNLLGDVRASAWGLLALVMIAHAAPEGALSGLVHLITFGTEVLIFCALFASWVGPLFATLVLGPERGRIARRVSFRPGPAS